MQGKRPFPGEGPTFHRKQGKETPAFRHGEELPCWLPPFSQ
jgi:hypothetical protein